jgi:hypothetical protein
MTALLLLPDATRLCLLFALRRKQLITEGRDGRHLYGNESPPDLRVAEIASRREFIECLCELRAVLCFNCIASYRERRGSEALEDSQLGDAL